MKPVKVLKKIEHCCSLMSDFLYDQRTDIQYNPIFREYYVPIKNMAALQILQYCPWCGKKLPNDLGEKFFDILEQEYGFSHHLNILQDTNLPEEFKSDAWWKKRGL